MRYPLPTRDTVSVYRRTGAGITGRAAGPVPTPRSWVPTDASAWHRAHLITTPNNLARHLIRQRQTRTTARVLAVLVGMASAALIGAIVRGAL